LRHRLLLQLVVMGWLLSEVTCLLLLLVVLPMRLLKLVQLLLPPTGGL
jgi:hypothetical protein